MYLKLTRALVALVVTPFLLVGLFLVGLAAWGGSIYLAWLLLGFIPGIDQGENGVLRLGLCGTVATGLVLPVIVETLKRVWRALRGPGVTREPVNDHLPW